MVFLELPKKTFVYQPAVLQELCSHPVVERRDQIPVQAPSDSGVDLYTSGNFNGNFLQEFRGRRSVVQLPLDVPVSPRPQPIRRIENAWINGLAVAILRPNPKWRYPARDHRPILLWASLL